MDPFGMARLQDLFGRDVAFEGASASLTHRFSDEAFFRGHFPGFPVVPGVILLDGMILAALHALGRARGAAALRSIAVETAAFYRPVVPGMAARFAARPDPAGTAAGAFAARCSVTVDGARHARAAITLLTQGDPP